MNHRARPFLALAAIVAVIVGACSTAATPAPTAAPATAAPATAAPATPAPATAAPATAAPATPAPTPVPTPASGGTLSLHLYQQYTSFYPWSESGTGGDSLVMELQWDFLAAYDEKGEAEMRLAESITASPDAKTWTVKLKPGLTWSDGTPLTSKDVLFSWRENANPNHSYNSGLWANVVGNAEWIKAADFSKDMAGITAPDDSTVVFQLIEPNAAFVATLLNFRNYILPSASILADVPNIATLSQKDVWALPYWQSPKVGVGPYLWDKTETAQFISFHKNPTWRGNPQAFDGVIVKPNNDTAVAAAQLQSGDLDLAVVTLDDLDGLAAAGLQTGTELTPFPIQSDMNNSKASRFADVKVRQAFMYGCDRQGFVDSFLKGKGAKWDSYFFPSWVPKDGITVYDFNLDKAKALLDEAKFDYSKPVVWLSWNKDARDRQSFLEDCQAQMKKIGVDIQIVNGLDVTNDLGKKGQWDLQLYGGYPIADPDQIRQFTACSAIGKTAGANSKDWPDGSAYMSGGANAVNWCNPTFDDLMNQASKIADQAQRADLYKQAQDIWLAEVPMMLNYRKATAYAWNGKLQGVVVYGDPSQLFLKIDQWSMSQ